MSGFSGYKAFVSGMFADRLRPTAEIIVSAEAASAIESCAALVSPGAPSMSTPGRSRTDTGDPFRGPASSLGLRGRIHNTAHAIA